MLKPILPIVLCFLAACDPCSGLGSCGAPRVRYEGTLSQAFGSRGPASGIAVRFVRTGGVMLDVDTVRGRSDEDGRFLLEAEARSEGEVVGDLLISPPAPLETVRIPGIRLVTSRASGELRTLADLPIPFPHFAHQARVFYRATGQPAVGVEVEFRRTGGITVEPDTFRLTVDERGFVILRPRTREFGELIGELVVYPLPPHRQFTVRGVRLTTRTTEQSAPIVQIGIGARLPYAAIVVSAADGKGVAGVVLEFRRTSGIPISPDPFVFSSSDASGTLFLDPAPLESGEVRGDVTLRPPPPYETVVLRDVRLQTTEDDRAYQLLGYFSVPLADTVKADQ